MSEEVFTKRFRMVLESHDINDAPKLLEECRVEAMRAYSEGYSEGNKDTCVRPSLPEGKIAMVSLNSLEHETLSLDRTINLIQEARTDLIKLSECAYSWRAAYYDLKINGEVLK